MSPLAPTLQKFFTDRLMTQRQVSSATIAAYRDTFRLLFVFVAGRNNTAPANIDIADVDAPTIAAFLTHLATVRHNSIRTPQCPPGRDPFAVQVRRVPTPRTRRDDRPGCCRSPRNATTRRSSPTSPSRGRSDPRRTRHRHLIGRRDHALLTLAVQTGLRVAELTSLRRNDVVLTAGPHVRCHGKGRKQRSTPLTAHTVATLRQWFRAHDGEPDSPLFPSRHGTPLSTDAVEWLVRKHATAAASHCPSLSTRNVTPHTFGTAQLFFFAKRASISRLSHSGSATKASPPPRSICTPISPSNKRALARTNPPRATTKRYRHPTAARLPRQPLIMPSRSTGNSGPTSPNARRRCPPRHNHTLGIIRIRIVI